jgi:hypothetical protein
MEEKAIIQTEKAYIKLYKMKGYYNWEVKAYGDTPREELNQLKEGLKELDDAMQREFGVNE